MANEHVEPLRHCPICNIILGNHSVRYCREPQSCDCYCVYDDGTFPMLTGDGNEYPRFISQERATAAGAADPYIPVERGRMWRPNR